MIEIARANARRAGVRLTFKQRALADWQHDGERKFVVTNPPYDARLEADTEFCRMVMASLSRMHGCRVAVITALPEYKRVMSLRLAAEIPLKNGPLDCRLLVYEVP
jgi:23S rRNA (guanine2445-N2)-methyltransferase / 23S rRNA (guanine2069-N7)-methyltransferase